MDNIVIKTMNNKVIKKWLKMSLYAILLVMFYILYMRNAIDQFMRGSTVIGLRHSAEYHNLCEIICM